MNPMRMTVQSTLLGKRAITGFNALRLRAAGVIAALLAASALGLFLSVSAQAQARTDTVRRHPPSGISGTLPGSQAAPLQRLQGDFRFILGVPQGDFDKITGDVGYGASGSLRVPLRQVPLQVGLDLGLLFFESDPTTLTSDTAPSTEAVVRYDTNVFMGHFLARFQPWDGTFTPYVDGLVGFKYLFSDARIERRVFPSTDPTNVATDLNDWALSYGLGAGVDVELLTGSRRVWFETLALSAGARYLFGSEAECVAGDPLLEGRDPSTTNCARTDLLVPQIGLTLRY